MLERGELSQVTANAELADRLMATARQHLASVRLLADSDPYSARRWTPSCAPSTGSG